MNGGSPSPTRAGRPAATALIALVPFLLACHPVVRVGAIVSLTGAAAAHGESVRKGLELAAAQINADPGAGGSTIELIVRDDATHPDLGVRAADELIDVERVGLIVGAVTSAVTLPVAAVCERRRVVLLSPTASDPRISDAGAYVFRNFPSDLMEGTSMAEFARDLGLDRIVVASVSNAYGEGLRKAFLDRLANDPSRVIGTLRFAEGDAAGLAGIVRTLRSLRPRAIYIAGYAAETAFLLRSLREAGVGAVVLGTSSAAPDLAAAGEAGAPTFVFPQPAFDPEADDPAVRAFIEAFRARYGEEPDLYAAHGYDALRIFHRAIQRAGSARPEAVRAEMLRMTDFRGAAGRTAFDDRGDVVRYSRMFVVKGGRTMPYERFVERGGTFSAATRPTNPVRDHGDAGFP